MGSGSDDDEDTDDDPFPFGLDDPSKAAFNPYRDIGCNDPCPCGSGKKFKKCYLLPV